MKRITTSVVLATIAAASLAGCTYHRTVVEHPVVAAPAPQPTTVIVPERKPDVVIVPSN